MIYSSLILFIFSLIIIILPPHPRRGKIIQPMGVTTDGKLAPLCGQTRHSAVQEEDEEEEDDSETEQ